MFCVKFYSLVRFTKTNYWNYENYIVLIKVCIHFMCRMMMLIQIFFWFFFFTSDLTFVWVVFWEILQRLRRLEWYSVRFVMIKKKLQTYVKVYLCRKIKNKTHAHIDYTHMYHCYLSFDMHIFYLKLKSVCIILWTNWLHCIEIVWLSVRFRCCIVWPQKLNSRLYLSTSTT